MKRFYTYVSPERPETGANFIFLLDGRAVITPMKKELSTPYRSVAALVAAEWDAQNGEIKPHTMHLTQILSTQIDKVAGERAAMTAQLLGYIDTDLLYYRTCNPEAVGAAQAAVWDPVIAAFETRFGVKTLTTTDLVALKQDKAVHKAIADYINGLDDARFTILQLVTPLAGSLVSGILFTSGALSAADMMAIARVEERYKDAIYDVEKYGSDPAQEKADAAMVRDLEAAGVYRDLLLSAE
jgi:chaperone required for assembly of F1-ATPase